MEKLVCKYCGQSKVINEFYKRDRTCKSCRRKKSREYYEQHKLDWYKYLRNNLKIKCAKCGYDKCLAALEFHHKDPNKKDFCIGNITGKALTKINLERALKEIEKCVVLCARCHKEIHYLKKEKKLFKEK